jgi:hypothetical protein
MDDVRVSVEELKRALAGDIDALLNDVAGAVNAAQAGRIIADSEEPVRDANAVFRQRVFEEALRLLQEKQEAFSPSAQRAAEQGRAEYHPSDD